MARKRYTETDWNKAVFIATMLYCLRDRGVGSDRKLRLFAAACCRRVWPLLDDSGVQAAVEVGERRADRAATPREARQANARAWRALTELCASRGYDLDTFLKNPPVVFHRGAPPVVRWWYAAAGVAGTDAETAAWTAEGVANRQELAANCPLLRDIFGNPFRPVTVDPAWRTSTVISLAEGIYEDRAFDRLPILADALQDAGCDDADILEHCRGPGPHVRGCWAVDLVLGKS